MLNSILLSVECLIEAFPTQKCLNTFVCEILEIYINLMRLLSIAALESNNTPSEKLENSFLLMRNFWNCIILIKSLSQF